jgi:hypothetical protein
VENFFAIRDNRGEGISMRTLPAFALILSFTAACSAKAAVPPPSLPPSAGIPEVLEHVIREYRKARTPAEWIERAPGLSNLEREALREDTNFLKGRLPKFELELPGANRALLTVDGVTYDLSYVRKGKLLHGGKEIPVSRRDSVFGLAQRLADKQKVDAAKLSFATDFDWLMASARADESLRRGCATKDLFTWYDVATGPVAFAPQVWIPAAVSALLRFAGNQARNCETQISEIQALLRRERIALKSVFCGSNHWGNDRKMEFWLSQKDAKGKNRTRTFSLDYTNAFAMEIAEPQEGAPAGRVPDKKMYVFNPENVREVRILRDKGEDFYGACDVVGARSKDLGAWVEFAIEADEIERYRKLFYYVSVNETCTACPLVETRIVSPRAPAFLEKLPTIPAFPSADPPPATEKGGSESAH